MRYNVIFNNGKVMSFYVKELAETYAVIYNGTLIPSDVTTQQTQPTKVTTTA